MQTLAGKVDSIDERVYFVKGSVDGNTIILKRVDDKVKGMDIELDEHSGDIVKLEYKLGFLSKGILNDNDG